MKKFLTVAFLLPACWALAQTPSARHSLALVLSPDLGFSRETDHSLGLHDQASLGFRLRLDYYRRLGARCYLKTGVGYAQVNLLETLDASNVQWPSQNNGNGQYDPTAGNAETGRYEFRHDFQFLQVPVGLRVDLTAGRLKWIAAAETGLMLRLGAPDAQRVQPYAGLSTGLEGSGRAGWFFSAQPVYRYHLRSNYPPDIAGLDKRVFLHSLGLEVAARKSF